MDGATWLHSLGMQQYEPAFRGNAVLPELAAVALKDLGASLVGDRRRLLAAIAALRNDIDPVPDRPVAPSLIERRQVTATFYDLLGSTAGTLGLTTSLSTLSRAAEVIE